MVLFTISAQILDALLIKTTTFAVTQSINIISWGGSSIYYYYMGRPLSDLERMELKVKELTNEVNLLKSNTDSEELEKRLGITILIK